MVYTQAPPLEDAEINQFIDNAKIVRICSINKDGTIHAVPVWFYQELGKLIVVTPRDSRKTRNISRNNNVTVLIDEVGPPTRGVIIYGKATIDEENMDATAFSIFKRYMSDEEAKAYWKGLSELTEWIKVIVTSYHIASFDYSKDTKYREATTKYLNEKS